MSEKTKIEEHVIPKIGIDENDIPKIFRQICIDKFGENIECQSSGDLIKILITNKSNSKILGSCIFTESEDLYKFITEINEV